MDLQASQVVQLRLARECINQLMNCNALLALELTMRLAGLMFMLREAVVGPVRFAAHFRAIMSLLVNLELSATLRLSSTDLGACKSPDTSVLDSACAYHGQ